MTDAASERRISSARADAGGGGFNDALARNRAFAESGTHDGLRPLPALGVLVLTCLDPRVDPAHVLRLELGDAMVMRNIGGRVTDEVVKELSLISGLIDRVAPSGASVEVAVIHHTECAARMLADDAPQTTSADPQESVVIDVERLRAATAISPRLCFSGHVYDVATGLVTPVVSATRAATTSVDAL